MLKIIIPHIQNLNYKTQYEIYDEFDENYPDCFYIVYIDNNNYCVLFGTILNNNSFDQECFEILKNKLLIYNNFSNFFREKKILKCDKFKIKWELIYEQRLFN